MVARFHRKIGSLMGLLAILMAIFAPAVSQTLAANRNGSALSAALCSTRSTSADAPANDDPAHSMASHQHVCGYCNLLAHLPALPGAQPVFAIAASQIRQRIANRFVSARRVPSFAAAQPRAPPV